MENRKLIFEKKNKVEIKTKNFFFQDRKLLNSPYKITLKIAPETSNMYILNMSRLTYSRVVKSQNTLDLVNNNMQY